MREQYERDRERDWYARNKERILERKKKWREANKELVSKHNGTHYRNNLEKYKVKRELRKDDPKWEEWYRIYNEENRAHITLRTFKNRIKKMHGLTIEQCNEMIINQGGKCLICKRTPEGEKMTGKLQIDHCHKTKKVRGMLCHKCNCTLGLVNEDVSTLESMIAYIREHKNV